MVASWAWANLSDGRIVACSRGYFDGAEAFALVRYLPNGELDQSFTGDGAALFPDGDREVYPLALTIDQTDKIVMVASAFAKSATDSLFSVFRFDRDGELDESFGIGGKVVTPMGAGVNVPRAVKIDKDGNVVVGGFNGDNKFVVVKYFDDGNIDTTFGYNGIATIHFNSGGIDTLNALAIQPDGRIIVGGDVQVGSIGGIRSVDFGVARLTKTGDLDPTFSEDGKLITHFVQPAASSLWALTLQDDGKILAAGDASIVKGLGVARYKMDGSLDESFGTLGKKIVTFDRTCHWEAIALQPDNNIVVGGYLWNAKNYDMAAVRLINRAAI